MSLLHDAIHTGDGMTAAVSSRIQKFILLAVTALATAGFASSATTSTSALSLDAAIELVVKIERNNPDGLSAATALAAIDGARTGQAADFLTYVRLGSPSAARWLIVDRLDDRQLEALKDIDIDHPALHLQEYLVLTFDSPGATDAARRQLAADAGIRSVTYNSRQSYSARVNDYFVSQTSPYSTPHYQWSLEAMRAMSPWQTPTSMSGWDYARGFGYVGVVDSGIDATHPDLAENFKAHFSQAFYSNSLGNGNSCISSANSLIDVDERGLSSVCPNQFAGHGTHIAGLIGATPDNQLGVAGLCWHCSLIIAKAWSNDRGQVADIINGVNHSIIRGAQLINRSGGDQEYLEQRYGPATHSCSQLAIGTDGYCDAIAFAVRRDVIFVAASGNNNNAKLMYGLPPTFATHFPAHDPRVISVAATTVTDAIWTNDSLPDTNGTFRLVGSNLDKVDFVAPGKQVASTFYRNRVWAPVPVGIPGWCGDNVNGSFFPVTGVGYDECTGTSMATPLVTGALAISRSINPLLSKPALLTYVTNTARVIAGQYGMPDVMAANVAVGATNGYLTPLFAMFVSGAGTRWNNFYTTAPQMAMAAYWGTMLPVASIGSYYLSDGNAGSISWYTAFPEATFMSPPRAYVFVYTSYVVNGYSMTPLYRLSKLQSVDGAGHDECGNLMPNPSKTVPVKHIYTTSLIERSNLMATSNCYRYDGVEGYVYTQPATGHEALYRVYHPTWDNYILVPVSRLAFANAFGYTAYPTLLGYVVPN